MNKDWKKLISALIENKFPHIKVVDINVVGLNLYYSVTINTDEADEIVKSGGELPYEWSEVDQYLFELRKYMGKRIIANFVNSQDNNLNLPS